jgi:hypothetical protein
MKKVVLTSILALSLLSLAPLRSASAQTAGAYSRGSYKFILDNDLVKFVEFEAQTDNEGNTSGRMTFTDEAKISDPGGDDEPPPRDGNPREFYISADFDAMTVEKNRALMNGVIRESSHKSYVGKWVQLVVEDNQYNRELPDTLTWRFCQPEPGGWIPSDAEVKGDRGAYMSWWATDAELKYDYGMPSPSLIPGELKRCMNYPLASYSFLAIQKCDGDIIVQQ